MASLLGVAGRVRSLHLPGAWRVTKAMKARGQGGSAYAGFAVGRAAGAIYPLGVRGPWYPDAKDRGTTKGDPGAAVRRHGRDRSDAAWHVVRSLIGGRCRAFWVPIGGGGRHTGLWGGEEGAPQGAARKPARPGAAGKAALDSGGGLKLSSGLPG